MFYQLEDPWHIRLNRRNYFSNYGDVIDNYDYEYYFKKWTF